MEGLEGAVSQAKAICQTLVCAQDVATSAKDCDLLRVRRLPCGSVVKNAKAGDASSSGREDPPRRKWNHCSIPAWETPWSEEPGGLQSMRSQRAGHDRVTDTHSHAAVRTSTGCAPQFSSWGFRDLSQGLGTRCGLCPVCWLPGL